MKEFHKSVVYQIYPKSCQDTTGSGTGDLRGVIRRLDYLKELGVDYLWLTPFFISPRTTTAMTWPITGPLTPGMAPWRILTRWLPPQRNGASA